MIDFRTDRSNKRLFINPYSDKTDTSVGVYDDIVIHYGRPLSDREIDVIERQLEHKRKSQLAMEEYLEKQLLKDFEEVTEKTIDKVVREKLDEAINKAFKK